MYTIFPCVAATSIVVPTPQSHGMKKLPVCTAKLPSSFPFHMPFSHKHHGYRAMSVVRQSLAPYSVRFLFVYVCVSASRMCYI